MQALLPRGSSINDRVSVIREDGRWAYFLGVDLSFEHPEEDRRSFRMFTAQLVCQGAYKQSEIVRTFGVGVKSVERSVKK